MSNHVHQERPMEGRCFVCGEDLSGSNPDYHEPVTRTYGDEEVIECRRCGKEWPCPARKAISRNYKKSREKRRA